MTWMRRASVFVLLLLAVAADVSAQKTWVGFDKDGYPGDDLLPALHKTFAWTGYWLSDPPGMNSNPWAGKRGVVRAAGFGFLLLFNGRLDAQLKGQDAAALGRADAEAAIAAAKREGFPAEVVIFLDQEEGGALLKEQADYMGAWVLGVSQATRYKAGVYCSGIAVSSGTAMISTAEDVARRFPSAKLWVWNDQCPPSPGCAIPARLDPVQSGFPQALVWQYAQSPRRPEDTAACARTYAADGECYAPGLAHSGETFIDLNASRSADPSRGR